MTSASIPTTARPAGATDLDDAHHEQSLVVSIAGRGYGIPVAQAREVVRGGRLVRVPGAPPEVLGVINVRGAVVVVFDPAAILHEARAEQGASIVLLENGTRLVGLAVDAVRDVRALEAEPDGRRTAAPVAPLDATALLARLLISGEEMGR